MESIIKEYKAMLLEGYNNMYISENEPFIHLYIYTNELIFRIVISNCTDKEKFINDCKAIADIIANHDIHTCELIKIQRVVGVADFSSLILIPYEYYQTGHEARPKYILEKTIWAVPIYDCEFSGDESPLEIQAMIRKPYETIDIADWKRNVVPKLKMSFTNYSTQSGTKNRIFKIATLDNLSWAMSVLRDDISYIGFENYKHEKYKITLVHGIPTLTPSVKGNTDNGNFNELIYDILLGNVKYPSHISYSDAINIEAIQLNSSGMIKLIDQNLKKLVEKQKDKSFKYTKGRYALYSKSKSIMAYISYSFMINDYYTNEGCSVKMNIEAIVNQCRISDIITDSGLDYDLKKESFFEFNNKTVSGEFGSLDYLDFYPAFGIYKNIESISDLILVLMHILKNIIDGSLSLLKDIEYHPSYYKFPFLTSLIVLHLNNMNTKEEIERLLEVAHSKKYKDLKDASLIIKK